MSPGSIIRRLLLRNGFVLHRVGFDTPSGVSVHLQALRDRGVVKACCLDNEPTIQADLLRIFPEEDVIFSYPIIGDDQSASTPGSSWPSQPDARFLAVIDINSLAIDVVAARLPWLAAADSVLLRGSVGTFWSGTRDWGQIDAALRRLGFRYKDLIDSPFSFPLRAPAGRIVLAWDRGQDAPMDRSRRHRVLETMTYLSSPLVAGGEITTLVGRGSFGFAAGLCNPGAVLHEGKSMLLARSERTPWPLQKIDAPRFYRSSGAFLLELDPANRIESARTVDLDGLDLSRPSRIEDFRLFRFRGQIVANHVVISDPNPTQPANAALRVDQLQARVALSVLDPVARRLRWQGYPLIDRPLGKTEKNWAMFSAGEELYLLYSFSPYVLLRCTDWSKLRFETVVHADVPVPFSGDKLTLRNSINPIDYDNDHWLHVVHRVYPGKQYTFWPVLIEKKTLRPVRAGSHPLACGGRSHSASILYLSSALATKDHVDLFFGLDDAAVGWSRVTRDRLDSNWVTLEGSA